MAAGDTPASALLDLEVDDNKLSVWKIEDDRGNLPRVAAAMASNRNFVANLDYALVEISTLESSGFSFEDSLGETADNEANRCHFNITQLTVAKIAQLANLLDSPGNRGRIKLVDVGRSIDDGVDAGFIDAAQLPDELKASLDKDRPRWNRSTD